MRQELGPGRPAVSSRWGRGLASVATPVPVFGNMIANTGNTLYTCPTGKKALVSAIYMLNTGGAITFGGWMGTSAVAANQFANAVAFPTGNFSWQLGILLNGGDSCIVQPTGAVGYYLSVWEFPASEPLVGAKAISTNGTVSWYTCPANKSAAMTFSWNLLWSFGCNSSLGAITIWPVFTPSGGSAQRMGGQQSLGANASFYWPFQYHVPHLGPGDALSWAATAVGVNVWGTFIEMEL